MQNSRQQTWGSILAGLVTVALAGSAMAKIGHIPRVWDGLIHAGIPMQAIMPIALLELSCLAIFLIPRTSVLGAFLLTGYLGGATLTHIVGGETLAPPLIVGLVVWISTWLRVRELHSVFPLRRSPDQRPAYDASQAAPSRI